MKRIDTIDYFGSQKFSIKKQELTLTVCEQCNLACSYCYLPGKNTGRKMTLEIGKKAIDYFLKSSNLYKAPQLILDFVGGEPLIEIELMDQLTDYFKIESYKMNHPWFNNYKIAFTTNGTLYRSDKVQKFVEKNKNCLYPAISLDGIEEKHDNARRYLDGRGSYQDVVNSAKLMLQQLPYCTIKATFGRGDIKYFKDSLVHFIELGFQLENIFANVVYEDCWEDDDDIIFEQQLVKLADYMIDSNICNSDHYGNIFSEAIGKPYTDEHLDKHWCNTGQAVIVGVDGSFYPCIRFLEMSFTNKERVRKIGDIHHGVDFDKLRPFRVLALKNCSPKKCLECEVASGCNMCSGQALDESNFDTIFNRPTHICKMHKARVRANNYFWQRIKEKENLDTDKFSYSRQLRIPKKKILNVLLSSDSPSLCNYDSPVEKDLNAPLLINLDLLKNRLAQAKKENYYINFIYPNHKLDATFEKIIADHKFQITRAYLDENSKSGMEDREIFILKTGQPLKESFSCINVILHIEKNRLEPLKNYVENLFSHGILRVNLVIDDLPLWNDSDLEYYREVLCGIGELIFIEMKNGRQKSLNVLTDRLILEKMNNCNAVLDHITLGPDGKLYLCPAFYYINRPLNQDDLETPEEFKQLLKLENAPICEKCDAYHCQRCYYRNLLLTVELNIPGHNQCTVSHIEREVSGLLQKKLFGDKLIPFPNRNLIVDLNYRDPFVVTKVW